MMFIRILAILAALLLPLFLVTATATAPMEPPEAVSVAEEAPAAAGEKTDEQPFLIQITEDDPATAYVLVSLENPVGLLPLPTEGEYKRTIRQTMPDGSEAVNVVHLTPEGFWMEESNCEGHDCIDEGKVTLENREERVLGSWVICLPHQLVCELMTREEAISFLQRVMPGGQ